MAQERSCAIILDDRKARSVASELGLHVVGTIGLLLQAKRQGHCPAIRPLLDRLRACGFHISSDLELEAMRLAGENP